MDSDKTGVQRIFGWRDTRVECLALKIVLQTPRETSSILTVLGNKTKQKGTETRCCPEIRPSAANNCEAGDIFGK